MSETPTPVTPKKRGRPPKAQPSESVAPVTALPTVSVRDRRLAHPFGVPSMAITLKTPGEWAIRIVNMHVRTGRLHDMTQKKGWTYVRPEELDGKPDEYGLKAKDGRLVRGEHGEEIIMKMPQADFERIQQAKAALNLRNLGGTQTKAAIQQETALKYGDEAGERVGNAITVTDGRERSELETV